MCVRYGTVDIGNILLSLDGFHLCGFESTKYTDRPLTTVHADIKTCKEMKPM